MQYSKSCNTFFTLTFILWHVDPARSENLLKSLDKEHIFPCNILHGSRNMLQIIVKRWCFLMLWIIAWLWADTNTGVYQRPTPPGQFWPHCVTSTCYFFSKLIKMWSYSFDFEHVWNICMWQYPRPIQVIQSVHSCNKVGTYLAV